MPRRLSLVCALIWAVSGSGSLAAAQLRPGAQPIDRARLMRDVTTLADPALEGRRAGSEGGIKARQWLVARFTEIGLTPAGTSGYLQPFGVDGCSRTAANVVGRVAGRDARRKTIVVTAHYDHVGRRGGTVYPGADDNASGVAALLAAAHRFAVDRPSHSMLFAALDAEEDGSGGAVVLLASLPHADIALNVNLDMVSRSDRHEIYAAGTSHFPWLTPILDDVRSRATVKILFGHDQGGGPNDWTMQSDHREFHRAGLPWVYFGVENHPDYHQPTDTADKIDPRFFGDAADTIVEALAAFDARLD